MPRKVKSEKPGEVLKFYMDEYGLNPFSLSKSISAAYQSIANILKGRGKISASIAIRLGQYFSTAPQYWLDVQSSSEIAKLSANKKFVKILKGIPKAVKPKGTSVKEPKVKNTKKAVKKTVKKKNTQQRTLKKTKSRKAGRK